MRNKTPLLVLLVLLAAAAACGSEANLDVTGDDSSATEALRRRNDGRHRMAGGGYTSCLIDDGGDVFCMGQGPIGDSTMNDRRTPTQVSGLHNVVDIAVADVAPFNFIAVRSDGTVWRWGNNAVLDGGEQDLLTPVQVSGLPKAAVAASGGQFGNVGFGGAALLVDGTVWSLGDTSHPVAQTAGLSNVAVMGKHGAIAVTSTGLVKQWAGGNTWTTLLTGAVDVDSNAYTSCAILANGAMKCWGRNLNGEVGDGTFIDKASPTPVIGLGGIATAVAISLHSTCAVVSGVAKCWGRGSDGSLGNGSNSDSPTPVTVSGLGGVTDVAAGLFEMMATNYGAPYAWGGDYFGELGNNQAGPSLTFNTPQLVQGGKTTTVVKVTAATRHTCALKSDQTVKCWGDNFYGELGNGTFTSSPSPTDVIGEANAIDIDAQGLTTCAVTTEGLVRCWGCPLTTTSTVCTQASAQKNPTLVSGIDDAVAVRIGGEYACALKANGQIVCWGADANASGVLGNGSGQGSATPVVVSGITDAVALDTASEHACAVLAGGAVKCWGDNFYGQLGNYSTTDAWTPVTAPSGHPAIAVATGNASSSMVSSDGTLWYWGAGIHGDGNGNASDHHSPTQVAGETAVVDVAGGSSTQCFETATGGVKCWGTNAQGERGDGGTTGDVYAPSSVKVYAHFFYFPISNVTSLAAGFDTSCVTTGTGAVWCWGDNHYGQIGNGTVGTDARTAVIVTGL